MISAARAVTVIRALAGITALSLIAVSSGHLGFSGSGQGRLLSLRNQTANLVALGRYAEAADLFETGYREAVALHDATEAVHFLNGVGASRFALLEYGQAIDALVRARDLARLIGNQQYLNKASANLCNLYMQIGDLDAARLAAEQGLKIPNDRNLSNRSQFLLTLGLLASNSGDAKNALEYFRNAVKDAEENGTEYLRFQAWYHYAQELFHSGDLDGAETAALSVYRLGHLETVRELRPAYLLLARIHRARGNMPLALALIERGLAVPARRSDRLLWRMYFLYERAMVRSIEQRPADAASDLRTALSYARDWREAIAPSDRLRSGAEYWLKSVYDAYIDVTTKRNLVLDAFLAVEEERSASLLQMLGEGIGRRSDQYFEDLANLQALEIARIASPATFDEKELAQVRQRLSETEARAGSEIISNSRKNNENSLPRNILSTIQRRIGPDEAVFSFHLGESGSVVWALTANRLEMHRLPERRKLADLAGRLRLAFQESAPGRERLGSELYSELFASISGRVLRKRSWIIASDDALFEAPFAALVVATTAGNGTASGSRPTYLVERHELNRIPSVFVLKDIPAQAAPGPFLGIGDGIYNTADERWTAAHSANKLAGFAPLFDIGRTRSEIELPRLVSSTYELKSCARAWHPEQAPILLTGVDASREKLLSALKQRPAVIHIAAHVLYPSGKPDLAFIHLGLNRERVPEILTAKDVGSLRADGALVVLSGCSSAAGNSVRGAGVMGLTRAWLLAGARAVVGSRWPVPDDTGDLFRSFYAHLSASGVGRSGLSSALQRAQLDMLRSSTWRSDPRYWSAFYLLTKE